MAGTQRGPSFRLLDDKEIAAANLRANLRDGTTPSLGDLTAAGFNANVGRDDLYGALYGTATPPREHAGGGAPYAPPSGGSAPSGSGSSAWSRYGTNNIPGAESVTWGDPGRLSGFNTQAWTTRPVGYEADSTKNTFGKIASRYAAKPSSLQQIVLDPDFKRFFPEARVVGFDKIDFGDGRPVDVLIAADPNRDSANAWSWQTGGGMPSTPPLGEGLVSPQVYTGSALTDPVSTTMPTGAPAKIQPAAYARLARGNALGDLAEVA